MFRRRHGLPNAPEGISRDAADRRRQANRRIFLAALSGVPYTEIAAEAKRSVDDVRAVLRGYAEGLYRVHTKWRLAEARCLALAMELRLLRIGKEAPPDRPLSTLDPPKRWARAYAAAGIETINQLRSVRAETLLVHRRFPVGAINWAVIRLDRLGLSHMLARPKTRSPHKRFLGTV